MCRICDEEEATGEDGLCDVCREIRDAMRHEFEEEENGENIPN